MRAWNCNYNFTIKHIMLWKERISVLVISAWSVKCSYISTSSQWTRISSPSLTSRSDNNNNLTTINHFKMFTNHYLGYRTTGLNKFMIINIWHEVLKGLSLLGGFLRSSAPRKTWAEEYLHSLVFMVWSWALQRWVLPNRSRRIKAQECLSRRFTMFCLSSIVFYTPEEV